MRGAIHTILRHGLLAMTFILLCSFAKGPSASDSSPIPLAFMDIISEGLSDRALNEAVDGFAQMKTQEDIDKDVLIVIDFTKSSNLERFYILDMKDTSLTHTSLVAHGRNTGNEFATSFSNTSGSYQSSLGFYRTAETYEGKHGLSLRLDGLEHGINHNARDRAIVIHQADYVSIDFASQHGRIGRSLGCPALPLEDYAAVIETIKEGCLLYIYGANEHYAQVSEFLSES